MQLVHSNSLICNKLNRNIFILNIDKYTLDITAMLSYSNNFDHDYLEVCRCGGTDKHNQLFGDGKQLSFTYHMPFVLAIICINLCGFPLNPCLIPYLHINKVHKHKQALFSWQCKSKHKCHLARALSIRQILLVVCH